MRFPPTNMWKGEDIFILGGGPSVKQFPIHLLKGKKVIGCNDAYLFGEEIVSVLIFGDIGWWKHHKIQSKFCEFRNPVFTNHPRLEGESRVIWSPRLENGFGKNSLGWNNNTGSSAINLALIMGAKRIFLIGFDMSLDDKGCSNWHPNTLNKINMSHYDRYKNSIAKNISMITDNWPGVEIINLNPDSAWDLFPKQYWSTILKDKEN